MKKLFMNLFMVVILLSLILSNYSCSFAKSSRTGVFDASMSTVMSQMSNTKHSILSYSGEEKIVMAVRDNIVYYGAATKLYRSTDSGKTDSLVANIYPNYFTSGHILKNGNVVMFTSNNKIYHSKDGLKFNLVDTSKFGDIVTPLFNGIDSNNSTVIFGEYSLEEGNVRLFRSDNSGESWQVVLQKNNPSNIRHWHSVNYIQNKWYVTTGDNARQTLWFTSSSDGMENTWKQLSFKNEDYKTLNIQYIGNNNIIWGSDADYTTAIFKANLDDLYNPVKLLDLPHACWGIKGSGNKLIAITSVEEVDEDQNAMIYVSEDYGATWKLDLSMPIDPEMNFGGFRSISGPNDQGEYFIRIQNLVPTDPMYYTIIAK